MDAYQYAKIQELTQIICEILRFQEPKSLIGHGGLDFSTITQQSDFSRHVVLQKTGSITFPNL